MSILEIVQMYWDEGLLYLLIGASIIQISPIKINPWSWLGKKIGNALNAEVSKELKALDVKVDNVQKKLEEHMTNNEIDNAKHFSSKSFKI